MHLKLGKITDSSTEMWYIRGVSVQSADFPHRAVFLLCALSPPKNLVSSNHLSRFIFFSGLKLKTKKLLEFLNPSFSSIKFIIWSKNKQAYTRIRASQSGPFDPVITQEGPTLGSRVLTATAILENRFG